ncbi:response regulator [Hansschlegelia sp. KR7-227]|uniref:response regulator n=1 Tax=Hansschlegelia sp. KR7-227 TaxID=3400914 RepID=UPI003C027F00
MPDAEDAPDDIRVLICAPFGSDAETAAALLRKAGYVAEVLRDLSELGTRFDDRVGALLLTEEALTAGARTQRLAAALEAQEAWSDLPVLLLAAPRSGSVTWPQERARVHLPASATNVTVLERPLGAVPLVSAVASALRARAKQYEIRDSIAAQRRAADDLDLLVKERTKDLEETLERLRAEIAERERAEEQLRQAHKMEAVGQLTGGIAHDFNNMLTGVMGSLDIINRRIASGKLDDLDRFMEAAATSAQRAANLTQRLLAFSRRQSLDPRAIDVNALVTSLEDLLIRTMGENIELRLELSPTVAPAIADANQLESAILNLAINARDAMPDGGALTIRTEAAETRGGKAVKGELPEGRYVVISIVDTGLGMSAETVRKAFDPFFTTKPIGQGTGLGLSMVYGFAKQSGGQVRISSRLGEGATVSLYLPAADVPVSPEPHPRPPVETVPHGGGERVLIVDDEHAVRQVLREALGELGYQTEEAPDGPSALRLLSRGTPFDLMVSDVGLPGMNGRQLAEEARRRRPELPILFVTGYAENAALRPGFLGPNMSLITKPFTLELVAEKVRDILRDVQGQTASGPNTTLA